MPRRRRLTHEDLDEIVRAGIASGAFLYPRDDASLVPVPDPNTIWRYAPDWPSIEEENPDLTNASQPGTMYPEIKTKGEEMNPTITLEAGEKRVGTNASYRVYFFYISPTGNEMGVVKAPTLARGFNRTMGGWEGTTRTQVSEYTVNGPSRLKMVMIASSFGQPNRLAHLYIDVDPDYEVIDFKGLDGFGGFRGRGRMDYKDSIFTENRTKYNLSDSVMRDVFGLKVLQPPRKTGKNQKVRSLIF